MENGTLDDTTGRAARRVHGIERTRTETRKLAKLNSPSFVALQNQLFFYVYLFVANTHCSQDASNK